ncbi:hypothetical protein JL100_011255 [Skermanella mucosa]|uniref:hypothetical protein n=1 Tax=Skermanella mucosa TaxID=1789672 RepID=UPI001E30AAD7|nr:hypothetical protein [Skermanella mucosa]UEM23277.1 hypothetical protein JL100_011255 [Skermanella mucosa]
MRYSPGAGRAIELLEVYDPCQHEIVDAFDRNLVEQRFDMGKPSGVGIGGMEAMNQSLGIQMARARRIDRGKHEVQFAFRQASPGMPIARFLGGGLQIGQFQLRNLEVRPHDVTRVLLDRAIPPDAPRRGGIDHDCQPPQGEFLPQCRVTGLRRQALPATSPLDSLGELFYKHVPAPPQHGILGRCGMTAAPR